MIQKMDMKSAFRPITIDPDGSSLRILREKICTCGPATACRMARELGMVWGTVRSDELCPAEQYYARCTGE